MEIDNALGFLEKILEIFLNILEFFMNNLLLTGLIIATLYLFKLYFKNKTKKIKEEEIVNSQEVSD